MHTVTNGEWNEIKLPQSFIIIIPKYVLGYDQDGSMHHGG